MTSTFLLELDPCIFFGVENATRVKDRLGIAITDRAYLPDMQDLQRDWVASVAAPAFKLLRAKRGAEGCRAFASIGTGSGVDALCAIELLSADVIGVTDLFEEVVAVAASNIRNNIHPGHAITLYAGAGDLLKPLEDAPRFDIIYENLPNLPLDEDGSLETGRTSAAFIPRRSEPVPGFVKDWMLVLHYLALVQARDFLTPGGVVISTIGARMPLQKLAEMAKAADTSLAFSPAPGRLRQILPTSCRLTRNGSSKDWGPSISTPWTCFRTPFRSAWKKQVGTPFSSKRS